MSVLFALLRVGGWIAGLVVVVLVVTYAAAFAIALGRAPKRSEHAWRVLILHPFTPGGRISRLLQLLAGGGRGDLYGIVVPPEQGRIASTELVVASEPDAGEGLDLELVHLGRVVRTYRTLADPTDTVQLLELLTDAIRRVGGDNADPTDYELVVRYAGERGVVTTVVAPRFASSRLGGDLSRQAGVSTTD